MNIRSTGYAVMLASSMLVGVCGGKTIQKSSAKPAGHSLVSSPNMDVYIPEVASAVQEAAPSGVSKTAKVLSESWSVIVNEKVKPEFFQKVINFANKVKTDPIDLTFILFRESKFNPKAKNGSYVGLIQMDKNAFNECVGRMMEYEQYKKEHPQEKISLQDYLKLRGKKGFKRPVNPNKISFSQYCNLPREKQFKYSEYYLNYRIHEHKLNNSRISSIQLWALIHRPAKCREKAELRDRQVLLNAVKYGGKVTTNGTTRPVKGIKELFPAEFKKIMSLKK